MDPNRPARATRFAAGDWRFLWTYLRRQRTGIFLLGSVLLVGTGIQLAAPLVLRRFIDTVVAGEAGQVAIWLAVIFVVISLVGHGFTAVETAVAEAVAWRSTNQLRLDAVRHCIDLAMPFHHDHTPGELVERVDGDVGLLSNLFSRFVVAVVSQLLLVLGILAALTVIEWRLGLLLAVLILISLVVLRRASHVARRAYLAYRQSIARLMGFLEERLAAAEDLQSSGAVAHTLRRFAELNRRLMRKDVKASVLGLATVWAPTSVLISLSTAAVLLAAAMLTGANAMTLGTVYLVFAFAQQLQAPLIALSNQMQDYQRALAGLTRVRAILAVPVEPSGERRLPTGALPVTFDRVTFSYRPDATVLDEVSFELPAGATMGIVGHTGGGKTTVARLLVGLYRPQQGVIRIGGVPTSDADLVQLRQRVALVTQDVHLIGATIRDNVALFDPAVSDPVIVNAIEDLGLGDWLNALPDGLDTVIGDGGLGLSAGQAQLLALTRVFVRDPGLVILDEASARLDPVTERLLDTAISRLIDGRTAVIIAHRLATLNRVDQVLMIEQGRRVEYGPREALVGDSQSRFHALLAASR